MLVFSAFLGVPVQFLLQFEGLKRTTVSHAALMVGLMPVILAVGAAIWAHERMDRIGWIASFTSTTGAAFIALGHTSGGSSPHRRHHGHRLALHRPLLDPDEQAARRAA